MAAHRRQVRRQRIDEHLRLGLLTPHVRLIGRIIAAESERQSRQGFEDLRFTFYKGKAEVFESLATLTLAFGGDDSAYQAYMWCEKAKSQMFVDALAPHLPSVRSHADEALLARVDRIRGELNGSYLQSGSENFRALSVTRAKEVEIKEDELVRTLSELSESDSEYVSLQHASSIRLE